jgi:hypothetical protein
MSTVDAANRRAAIPKCHQGSEVPSEGARSRWRCQAPDALLAGGSGHDRARSHGRSLNRAWSALCDGPRPPRPPLAVHVNCPDATVGTRLHDVFSWVRAQRRVGRWSVTARLTRCGMAERPLPTANAILFNMTLGHGLLRRLYPTKPTRLAAASSSLLISRIAITYAQGTKISKPSCRLPVPSQLPSVLAKSPAGWPSSLSLPVTAKAGAPARWLRFGSSNCRLHGNFSNQGASTTSSTRSFSLIRISHISPLPPIDHFARRHLQNGGSTAAAVTPEAEGRGSRLPQRPRQGGRGTAPLRRAPLKWPLVPPLGSAPCR